MQRKAVLHGPMKHLPLPTCKCDRTSQRNTDRMEARSQNQADGDRQALVKQLKVMSSALYLVLLFSALWTLSFCGTRQFHVVNESKNWTDAQKHCRANFTDLATIESQEEMNAVIAVLNGTVGYFWIGLRQKELPLILINQNKTWREALRYCRENHVDLVSVHTEEIQRWVESAVYYASTANVWMGLRHTCAQSFWFWVSGSTICYQNWAPGNGTGVEDCSGGERTGAVQSGSKQWVSLPEDQRLNFICTTSEEI
ncbi:hypothetical protein AOLI_G00104940 [Acnodon oligacanthus]